MVKPMQLHNNDDPLDAWKTVGLGIFAVAAGCVALLVATAALGWFIQFAAGYWP
jgi:hypothetical protein